MIGYNRVAGAHPCLGDPVRALLGSLSASLGGFSGLLKPIEIGGVSFVGGSHETGL